MDPDDVFFRAPSRGLCDEHTDDDAVRVFIQENATLEKCDYCGREQSTPVAVWFADFAEFVLEAIATEWATAEEEALPWESREGGYQLATPLETYDLLGGETDLSPTNDANVLQDLVSTIPGDGWVQRDFAELSPIGRLQTGWDSFAEDVKHSRRYFFVTPTTDSDAAAPAELLDTIGRAAETEGLVVLVDAGSLIFRVRVHDAHQRPATARELGAPPAEHALNSNRMSPAGISLFYGALDADTARIEALAAARDSGASWTIGRFVALCDLRMLNLAGRLEVPSPFDRERRHLRPQLAFLSRFVRDLEAPIVRDRLEHVGYVPTQIVTEYLRSQFRLGDRTAMDGILYGSAQSPGGINAVLFADNKGARDVPGSLGALEAEARERGALIPSSFFTPPLLELSEWAWEGGQRAG